MSLFRFRRSQRLLTAKAFKTVFDNGVFIKTRSFFAYVLPSELPYARLGLVVAKKRAPKAVQRNRFKRLIRESFRQHTFKKSVDVVVGIRNGAIHNNNAALQRELETLWQRD